MFVKALRFTRSLAEDMFPAGTHFVSKETVLAVVRGAEIVIYRCGEQPTSSEDAKI